jgi:LmbE family N-acetylglucosaminyl deacetylase
MRVLAIAAHPDDIEWLCGGTLALCAQRGDEVFIAIATNGNVGTGDPSISREQIAETRHKEAIASASIIGAKVIWMNFDDEWLFNNETTRTRFIDAIREARPDIMFVLSENDYHPDHRLAGTIAIDSRIPTVFLMDTVGGNNFEPEFYVDVTSVMDLKDKMLSSHVSQIAWTAHVFDTAFTENMYAHARFRGYQAGCKYAEGFKLLPTWPRTGDMRLLPSGRKQD